MSKSWFQEPVNVSLPGRSVSAEADSFKELEIMVGYLVGAESMTSVLQKNTERRRQ